MPYMTCGLDFSNYSVVCNDDSCVCVGYCSLNPNFCNQHGICNNQKDGPTCECYDGYRGNGIPTKQVYVVLKIKRDFEDSMRNPSSLQYKKLETLAHQLDEFFRKAAPKHYKGMTFYGVSSGSIIVNTSGSYYYTNNQTKIEALNNNLESDVKGVFNSSETLDNITSVFDGSAELISVSSDSPIINVTQLKVYMTCALDFANYSVSCDSENCSCVGYCAQNPYFCNQNGVCYNRNSGPVCE
ncbi:hypothetical protein NDU88_010480 [Pleurodeles waltl]|uniref:SEA domain-containing protein n=1 Tax=Pleurodeles waltl TaxID=8319 RepID=A0AAV7R0G1_PLEWA|nr:hypothetical protein NDU88_010480 [Pleurodeles waltl]